MTRRLHTTGMAGILTALALSASVALANPAEPADASNPPQDRVTKMAERLDLDADQTAALETMEEEIRTAREAVRPELDAIQEAIKAELAMDEPNRRAIHKLLDERLTIDAEQTHDRMDAMLTFRGTLTAHQCGQLDAMMEQRSERQHRRPSQDRQSNERREQR